MSPEFPGPTGHDAATDDGTALVADAGVSDGGLGEEHVVLQTAASAVASAES